MPIPAPSVSAQTAYEISISRIRNSELARRLTGIAQEVARASRAYAAHASADSLHLMPRSEAVADVTKAELVGVYDQRFVHRDGPGRWIYDQILVTAPGGRCASCGVQAASTLDHFLPLSKFTLLGVNPSNLVPACRDCNSSKSARIPAGPGDVVLHPYFDDVSMDLWLVADLDEEPPAVPTFRVSAPLGWSDTLADRVRNHFRCFELGYLYSIQAADELANVQGTLSALHAAGGADAVHEELQDRATSAGASQVNSWRSASYSAWASSRWFCDGGFA